MLLNLLPDGSKLLETGLSHKLLIFIFLLLIFLLASAWPEKAKNCSVKLHFYILNYFFYYAKKAKYRIFQTTCLTFFPPEFNNVNL